MTLLEPVGLIGLGDLGAPVAANLLGAGADLTVYNRTASKAEPLAARGAKVVARPWQAVRRGGIVFSLLWDADSVREVVESEGFLDQLGDGGLHVSMSTIDPESAKSIAALHSRCGATMISAPIFGRPEAAVARELVIAISGDTGSRARVEPFLRAAGGKSIFDFGEDAGAALMVKIAGNFLILSAATALNEALSTASAHGVDKASLVDMLTSTMFPAPIYKNYGGMIINGAPPAIDSAIGGKDVSLFANLARAAGLGAPMADAILSTRSKE